jgi:DNA-binding beta-propeller fold protein YncE
VAADNEGHVYVADGYYSIQKFTADGVFITWWAMRDQYHGGAERLAVDALGNVYVTDNFAACIKKYTATGWLRAQWPVGSGISSWVPAVAVDGDGNVYVTDTGHHRILKYARRR